ncbi:MAG TPA: hypothetical protein VK962_03470 [Actinomycetota bacterium]|nr:hypothetical protein [Actinomycetota bacterium]
MTAATAELRQGGIEVHGVLGDSSPIGAIRDAVERLPYDEIIICTLPARISRWLKQDLPTRAARAFTIPVTHIVADGQSDDRHRRSADPAA